MGKIRCRLRNGIVVDADEDLCSCNVVSIPKNVDVTVSIGSKITLVYGLGRAWGNGFDIVEKGIGTKSEPTKPTKSYTVALRDKLKNYASLYTDKDIECLTKAIVRLNRKYWK